MLPWTTEIVPEIKASCLHRPRCESAFKTGQEIASSGRSDLVLNDHMRLEALSILRAEIINERMRELGMEREERR